MLKFLVTNLVPLLVSAVIVRVLLDGVVGEVHEQVCTSFEGEERGGSSYVALGEPVGFKYPVEGGKEKVMSDIKFSTLEKQRLFYVLLYDEGSERPIMIFFLGLDSESDFLLAIANSYTDTSIAIFSRFHNPHIFDTSSLLTPPLLPLLEHSHKVAILRILYSFGDMKGKRKHLKDIFILKFIVFLHMVE
jgi:hypothetical protein